jgi:NADPH2:quinone reductase
MGDAPLEKGLWGGAVDSIGGAVLAWLIRSTRTHGNIAVCGLAGGVEINLTVMPFILRGTGLLGVGSSLCPMPLRLQIWQRLAGDFKPADLSQLVTATIPLKEVVPIASEMMAGQIQGRYVVKIRNL